MAAATDPTSVVEAAQRAWAFDALDVVSDGFVVTDERGKVVGYAYGGPHRDRAAYNSTVEVSAYIDRNLHRTGIGRRLYSALFERLRERGYRLLVAGITLPNEASVGIHEALGFEPVGIYKNIGFKNGEWWDVGWWQLDLFD